MFMKLILSFTVFLFMGFQVYGQDIFDRLLLSYSKFELEQMIQNSPEKYQLLEYALGRALSIEPYNELKHGDFEKISLKTKKQNPYFTEFGLKIKDKRQNFLWVEKNVVISISPFSALNHLKKIKQ